jgi:hypothetical protein
LQKAIFIYRRTKRDNPIFTGGHFDIYRVEYWIKQGLRLNEPGRWHVPKPELNLDGAIFNIFLSSKNSRLLPEAGYLQIETAGGLRMLTVSLRESPAYWQSSATA